MQVPWGSLVKFFFGGIQIQILSSIDENFLIQYQSDIFIPQLMMVSLKSIHWINLKFDIGTVGLVSTYFNLS